MAKSLVTHFKLNDDGSTTSVGLIGAGGVIRDDTCAWFHGFMRNIGTGQVLQAEARGLFSSLHFASDLRLSNLRSDSAVLNNLLH